MWTHEAQVDQLMDQVSVLKHSELNLELMIYTLSAVLNTKCIFNTFFFYKSKNQYNIIHLHEIWKI